jgi:hypothetical protein
MQRVQVGLFELEGGRFLQCTCSRSGTTSDSLLASNWQESEKRHDVGSLERAGQWDGMEWDAWPPMPEGHPLTAPESPDPFLKCNLARTANPPPGLWSQSLFSSSFWKSTEEVSAQNEPRRFWCQKVQEDKSAMQLDPGWRQAWPASTSTSTSVKHLEKCSDRKIKALELSLGALAPAHNSASLHPLMHYCCCYAISQLPAKPECGTGKPLHDLCRNK